MTATTLSPAPSSPDARQDATTIGLIDENDLLLDVSAKIAESGVVHQTQGAS